MCRTRKRSCQLVFAITGTTFPFLIADGLKQLFLSLSEKLIGTWETNTIEDGVAYQIEESFYPANEFSGTAQVVNSEGETFNVRYSGTWKIKDGYLHY